MYIRNRKDAMDVLGEILGLPGRTDQLVQLTVKIVLCLDADPRTFLADAQASLVEDGLEAMRLKRRERMAEAEFEPILILDAADNCLFEEVASTRDALRMADVVREVFPEIANTYPRWQVGRAVLAHEKEIQNCTRNALRARRKDADPFERSVSLSAAVDLVRAVAPPWARSAARMHQACMDVVRGAQLVPEERAPAHAEFLFACIALHDHRAEPFLEWIAEDAAAVVDCVGRLHELCGTLDEVERGKDAGPGDTGARKRTA